MKNMIAALLLPSALSLLVTGAAAQPAPPRGAVDCIATMGALPDKWEGTAYAIDGDTLAGVGLKPHIRIWGIQAPELRDKDKQETVAGMRSRATAENLLISFNRKTRCDVHKFDRYCRLVARCTVGATDIDIGELMIREGMAYTGWLDDTMAAHPALGDRYGRFEQMARQEGMGLWPMWMGTRK